MFCGVRCRALSIAGHCPRRCLRTGRTACVVSFLVHCLLPSIVRPKPHRRAARVGPLRFLRTQPSRRQQGCFLSRGDRLIRPTDRALLPTVWRRPTDTARARGCRIYAQGLFGGGYPAGFGYRVWHGAYSPAQYLREARYQFPRGAVRPVHRQPCQDVALRGYRQRVLPDELGLRRCRALDSVRAFPKACLSRPSKRRLRSFGLR